MSVLDDNAINELARELSKCNPNDINVLWVSSDACVHVEKVPEGVFIDDWLSTKPGFQFRYEVYAPGSDYVGESASKDQKWLTNLLNEVVTDFNAGKTGCVDY